MKYKNQIIIFVYIFCFATMSFGQLSNYKFRKQIIAIKEPWNKIILNEGMYQKIKTDFSDLRIIGFTKQGDTLEVPYLIKEKNTRIIQKKLTFSLINKSSNDKGYYYTFELPSLEYVNQINLKFHKDNYDWKINLEGSQNIKEWFNIIADYRILSINNSEVNFNFSNIVFSKSKYNYYRLHIKSIENPEFENANILITEDSKGEFQNYTIRTLEINENKQKKQTQIKIRLNDKVPVNQIKINVGDKQDFYRPINISYIQDSVKTEKGWKYNVVCLSSGVLNSFESNLFTFDPILTDKFEIVVNNFDNMPLEISNIILRGPKYELIGRYEKNADFYLYYGNKQAIKPNYDIQHYENKIPQEVSLIALGQEEILKVENISEVKPIIENKVWLWIIIFLLVSILGWFSLKMIKK